MYQEYQTHKVLNANTKRAGAYARTAHADQVGHYTHQMSNDAKEASGRFVIRLVPLLYGVVLGYLFDNLVVGILIGAIVAITVDLRTMGERSLFRPLARRAVLLGCPFVAAAAHALAARLAKAGRRAPARLRNMRCGLS